jgi:hypothetical protein
VESGHRAQGVLSVMLKTGREPADFQRDKSCVTNHPHSEDTPRTEVASDRPLQSSSERWRSESLLTKVALDLFIVFVGVSAAFAVDNFRSAREQDQRRQAIYRALDHELAQMAQTRGPALQREMTQQLAAWDSAAARGDRPMPPTFRIPGAERPPTGVWDAAVATDSIELVDPDLFYELARFYNRAQSAGDLYQRYASGAEVDIWPRLREGPSAFWQGGQLRPGVATDVQRLREFRERQGELSREADQLLIRLRRASRH